MGLKLGQQIEIDDGVTSFDVDGIPLSLQTSVDSKGLLDHYRKLMDVQPYDSESAIESSTDDAAIPRYTTVRRG
jgi:hypothetical protein